MLERDTILTIAEQVLAASGADQTEVAVSAYDAALTRFANNVIHQNVQESNARVKVRAVVGKRQGVVATNDTSPESLKQVAQRALEAAQNAAPTEDFVSLPGPPEDPVSCDLRPVPATADCSPADRAASVKCMLDIARAEGLEAAGQLATGVSASCVVNSLGIRSYFEKGSAGCTVVMQAADSSGFAEAHSDDVSAIDTCALARTAAHKALTSAGPTAVEPGEYTVILEPLAVGDMVSTLAMYDLHSLAHQEGRSFTTGHMGEQVCAASIDLWDDGLYPRSDRVPFDGEGVPRSRVEILKGGVLSALPYDSYTAGREPGAVNTGHALPAPHTWGPVPLNLFLGTGDSDLGEMIAATDRGILVTRFHYTNMVHPVRTVFTGMTRDGTFLIEKGQVVGGIKNLRFTQSILEALSNTDMIGREGVLCDYAWVPALRTRFAFTSGTSF